MIYKDIISKSAFLMSRRSMMCVGLLNICIKFFCVYKFKPNHQCHYDHKILKKSYFVLPSQRPTHTLTHPAHTDCIKHRNRNKIWRSHIINHYQDQHNHAALVRNIWSDTIIIKCVCNISYRMLLSIYIRDMHIVLVCSSVIYNAELLPNGVSTWIHTVLCYITTLQG